tara:strand:- start:28558 stop:29076 length:519 start_codon:yes stop_codon:yes gene_type:complete
MTPTFHPRIYVACLAAYNNGHLHGSWIDATQDTSAIRDQINAMLSASPIPNAEEFAIHDYEDFGAALINEYDSVQTVSEIALFLREHGSLGALVLEHVSSDLSDAQDMLARYAGTCRSSAEFAEGVISETCEVPDRLQYYIDYEAIARDMELNGDVISIEERFEEVHVFWGH